VSLELREFGGTAGLEAPERVAAAILGFIG
jgi:hypothetical protein